MLLLPSLSVSAELLLQHKEQKQRTHAHTRKASTAHNNLSLPLINCNRPGGAHSTSHTYSIVWYYSI